MELLKRISQIKNNKKLLKIITFASIFILITSSLGCIQQGQGQEQEKVEDMLGREIDVPNEVNKVIGVGPGSLKMITYLNATDKVVGVEKSVTSWEKNNPYNLANPELREKPVIGPHHGGEAELIAEQKPDIIIGSGLSVQKANELQEKTETPVFMLTKGKEHLIQPEKLYNTLQTLGKVLNKENRANKLMHYTENIIKDLNERTKTIEDQTKPEVYIGGRSYSGGTGILSTQKPFTPFFLTNSENAAENLDGHAMISREKLIQWNPEIIFISGSNLDPSLQELKKPKYQEIKAVQNNQIYAIHPSVFYGTNFETILANSYYIGKQLYPQQFKDINPEQKADEIFKNYVGKEVFDQVDKKFPGFEKVNIEKNN